MQPVGAKSNDAARNQVRVGEGHFAPSTYQGYWDWPVDTSRSTGVQKCERWTVGLPRNCAKGKQDGSPENTKRRSRGPSTRWAPRNRENKHLIREKVWFPGVDKMVKEKVDSCLSCQAATTSKAERLEPPRMTPLPNTPWKDLAMDFLGSLPSGEYLMLSIDRCVWASYIRWWWGGR